MNEPKPIDATQHSHDEQWLAQRSTNLVLDRLSRGEYVLALGIRHSRTIDIVKIAQASGHHAIWVDLEHSAIPLDLATQMCSSALDLGIVPFVRIPEREYGAIGRLLDGGALGIIAPRIETVEEARDVAAATGSSLADRHVAALRHAACGARGPQSRTQRVGCRTGADRDADRDR